MNDKLPDFNPAPVILSGSIARLEPLTLDHGPDLLPTVSLRTWQFMVDACPQILCEMEGLITRGLIHQVEGSEVPFVIRRLTDNRVVGSTRYMSIIPAHRVVEIGFTWLAEDTQRTGINTEVKFLLLDHAFKNLGALRVEFKTDARNLQSIRALERIGATKEGILRNHRICADGHNRDSVYFSILHTEWEQRTRHFQRLMRR